MEQTQDLASAIDYFDSQAEFSPFAAQVAEWLRELQHTKATKQLKVYRMSHVSYTGYAYIAAETLEQAKKIMPQYKWLTYDGRTFKEFPMLSANVDKPQVIINSLSIRIGSK